MKVFKELTDEALDKWMSQARRQFSKLQREISSAVEEKGRRTALKEVDEINSLSSEEDKIIYYLAENDESSMERYRASEAFWTSKGLMTDGYIPETNQRCLEVVTYLDRYNNDQVVESLEQVLPFVKEVPQLSAKVFRIFEHTLSQGGVYELLYSGKWVLIKTTYGREDTIKEFDTTAEMVEYVSQNHWYQETK